MSDPDTNHWFDDRCAEAFWDQRQAAPYQDLLADTLGLAGPQADERWLDLGCGGGALTEGLWAASGGRVASVLAIDCSAANARSIGRIEARHCPGSGRIAFRLGDLSAGLPGLADGAFDGVTAGLALSYAESRDRVTGKYTDAAYARAYREAYRVLRPGGRLVLSVNVPEPRFWRVFWRSLGGGQRVAHARRVLVNALRMLRYGAWLKREARRGRFHFLPIERVLAHVRAAGFADAEYRLSYAGQAYVVRAVKPATAASGTAYRAAA